MGFFCKNFAYYRRVIYRVGHPAVDNALNELTGDASLIARQNATCHQRSPPGHTERHLRNLQLLESVDFAYLRIFPEDIFLPLDEAVASRAIFVIVSGLDGRAGGNAFGAS